MIYQRNTKSSVRLWADEDEERKAIVKTVEKLAAYEARLVEASFFTCCEIFIGVNVPTSERAVLIAEVTRTFSEVLESMGLR